jgi:hypothetical protein
MALVLRGSSVEATKLILKIHLGCEQKIDLKSLGLHRQIIIRHIDGPLWAIEHENWP